MLLGIDTATWTASVALVDGDAVLAERSLPTSGSHGFSLVPLIEEVLGHAGATTGDLRGVAVSIGPGSFTGLRIGLATAKGLAFAQRIPIVGVRTLPALALAAGVQDGLVCPLLDARKGEVYAALVEIAAGQAIVRRDEAAAPLAAWLDVIGDRACTFIGDGVSIVADSGRAVPQWTLLPFETHHPRGSVVARLGAERLGAGQSDDLAALEPLYVRPSEAELGRTQSDRAGLRSP
jgi:tRNA threonylcarbamoyladenosine biosynthesis protein TsaB